MKNKGVERRRYIRLDSVFPVEFRILKGEEILTDWIQGFTRNVSLGGLCLEAKLLSSWQKDLLQEDVLLEISLHIPLARDIKAKARAVWKKEEYALPLPVTLLGLEFVEIEPKKSQAIISFARKKIILPRLMVALIVLLFVGTLGFWWRSHYLESKSREILKNYIEKLEVISQRESFLSRLNTELNFLKRRLKKQNSQYEILLSKYNNLKKDYERMKGEFSSISKEVLREKEKALSLLEEELQKLRKKNEVLKEEVRRLSIRREDISSSLNNLKASLKEIEAINIESLYGWLKNHRFERTGLVLSYEGDPDLRNISFSYDQALSVLTFLLFEDIDYARKILEFYGDRAERENGGFYNAYFTDTGKPAEYIIHSGPNLWIGISTLHYIKKTEDRSFLNLAEDIARFILKLQREDREGGIRGGPRNFWYSTEHNLDAYAFFTMLYELTGRDIYKEAREKTISWLEKYALRASDIPINRGRGDSTIATDTYAWSLASISPQRLYEIDMDPEEIIKFAEEHCRVKTFFQRPDGLRVEVEGFDFAPQRNLGRGGVISCEWTAQMVLAFKILSKYFYEQADFDRATMYLSKAMHYLGELKKMFIVSPSPIGRGKWCLPYASQSNVDTGHGWRTPKGKDTGSVSATSYFIFAYYDFNPLSFRKPFQRNIYTLIKEKQREILSETDNPLSVR